MKEQQKQEKPLMPHVLSLSERNALSVSGVQDVDSFDEDTVILYTALGELTVKGSHLHVQRLCIESGDLTLVGDIDSLTYSELKSYKSGLFGKLFR